MIEMVLCDLCKKRKAVIKIRYAGLNLCKECLSKFVEQKVMLSLKRTGVLGKLSGKYLIIALSGGKDSINATYIMHKLSQEYDFKMKAVFVDEGIGEYSKQRRAIVMDLCKKLGIEYRIVSMKEEMGISTPEAVSILVKSRSSIKPCSVCGVFRRYLLNKVALDENADYVVTGHNLDDEVQTFIMSLIRGDIRSIAREACSLGYENDVPKLVSRIKPLYLVYERESLVYFITHGFKRISLSCPYARFSMRYVIREMINDLEYRRPGMKYRILALKERLGKSIRETVLSNVEMRHCKICGMPSSRDICRACELKELLVKLSQNYKGIYIK